MSIIKFYRGDTPTVEVTVTEDGEIFDLTGWTATLTCRTSKSATSPLFSSILTNVPNPTDGIILFELTSSNTDLAQGKYVYDVEVKKDDKVYTIVDGWINIIEDVTK